MFKKLLATTLALTCLFSVGCTRIEPPQEPIVTEEITAVANDNSEPEIEVVPENPTVNVICVGDNLIHNVIYRQASNRAVENGEEGYDFDYAYQYVEELIAPADLAILNQETIVTDEFEPSNYPMFCSPQALGDKMIEMGFDAVSVSNNHILDKGEKGLIATLNYWRENHPDIAVYGAYQNREDMENIRTLTVNGITFAFVGFMEHTNGLSLPENSECELVYLEELEEVEAQIRKANDLADCVVVSVHYGLEVANYLTDQQLELTPKFVEWGADLIIGTQPHTAQTMEYLDKPDGGQAFVFYCLGNFISAMDNPRAMVGMIGNLNVTKDLATGEITISEVKAVPLITQYGAGSTNVRVYPYWAYDMSLVAQHGCARFSESLIEEIIGYIPEEFLTLENYLEGATSEE